MAVHGMHPCKVRVCPIKLAAKLLIRGLGVYVMLYPVGSTEVPRVRDGGPRC